MVGINGRGDGNNMKLRFPKLRFVGGKFNRTIFNRFVADLFCRVNAAFIKLNFSLVDIKANNPDLFRKRNGNRHSDIA